jgi:hypothetical protein
MENVFGRANFKLLNLQNTNKVLKYVKDPSFKNEHVISDNYAIFEFEKPIVEFSKPVYSGFAILEKSKLHIYKLHYDVIKKFYGKRACLMYTDTDSFVYEIETDDFYRDLTLMEPVFDTSVYPKFVQCFNTTNKGKLGTLKDEFPLYKKDNEEHLNLITEFSCLRSKCYALTTLGNININKCKGILGSEVKKYTIKDYNECLYNNTKTSIIQTTFQSINHQINTINLFKECLSSEDSKRVKDPRDNSNIYTVPHGYFT